jgi:hypothetical protein
MNVELSVTLGVRACYRLTDAVLPSISEIGFERSACGKVFPEGLALILLITRKPEVESQSSITLPTPVHFCAQAGRHQLFPT